MLSIPSRRSRIDPWLGFGCLASWLLTIAVWLWDVEGGGAPLMLKRSVIAGAGLITTAGLIWLVNRIWTGFSDGSRRFAARALLILVVISFGVRFVGLDWEVSGRYYRDEGIYYAAAEQINKGELLPESFIYGHLPYYFYAVALWGQSVWPELAGSATRMLYGTDRPVEVSWLLMRGVNAALGALTTIPVFVIGYRIAGLLAGSIGALLIIFSPIYNEISRLIISDLPSAFFATVSLMFVAFLIDEESPIFYVMSGVAAGLAAACKYPAGVVVIAIVAVWIYWRLRNRDWSWSLVVAGAASLLTFLAVMPAFWAHSNKVFMGQGKDLLFGLRQYGRGGWIGVMPGSNFAWYGRQLIASFSAPALTLGLTGWFWLDACSRRRFALMLAYPLVFLVLLFSMSMVVKRNLLPVLPALAALLGVGIGGWLTLARHRRPNAYRLSATVVLIACLAWPVAQTLAQTIAFSSPSTRELASTYIQEIAPWGAAFIQESYTPHLHFKKYPTRKSRFAARLPMEQIRDPQRDYLLLSQNAYGRFLEPANWAKPHHEIYSQRYHEMLEFDLVQDFAPDRFTQGPYVRLFKIDPEKVVYHTSYRFDFEAEPYRFPKDGGFLLLKEYFEPGTYEIRAQTDPADSEGRVRVVSRTNQRAGEVPVGLGPVSVEMKWRAKYFFYVYLPKDTLLQSLQIARLDPDG